MIELRAFSGNGATRMIMISARKTPGDALREEIQKEKAEVLCRTAEMLAGAIEKLRLVEAGIDERLCFIHELTARCGKDCTLIGQRQRAIRETNGEIDRYNELREHAKLRYYYLIVTREALGLRRHDRVEEIYAIPGRKGRLHADDG
jgi:hypothetical protein